MEFKDKASNENISTDGSYVEGSVSINGDGDFVGDNKIIGLTGIEVNKIIETLLRYFPRTYINAENLEATFLELDKYHQQLYEWKELHNNINEIMTSFDPFESYISNSDAKHKLPNIMDLFNLWRPVSRNVDILLDFAGTIKCIGKQYYVNDTGTFGEKWAVEIGTQKDAINSFFEANLLTSSIGWKMNNTIKSTFYSVRMKAGVRPLWWLSINEMTRSFKDATYRHMYLADKRLREAATELYHFSRKTIGSKNI